MPELPDVAIFGTDKSTEIIVPLLKAEGFHIKAIWGTTLEEAQYAAQSLNIPFATNQVDEVLLRKDVDLIVILTPPFHHSKIAVKALGIGKHVTVQPVGGLDQDETTRMVQAAQYYPRLLSTLHTGLRFLPAFSKMRRALDTGLIGTEVNFCDVRIACDSIVGKNYSWRCDETMGGGVLQRFGSHIIDLLQFLTGQKVVRVSGNLRTFTKNTDNINGIRSIRSDDCTTFQMEFDEGVYATVTLNSQLQGFTHEVFVCGNEGHLVARGGDLFVHRKDSDREEVLFRDETDQSVELSLAPNDCDPLTSGIYLKGLVLLFRHLAKKFADGDIGNYEPVENEMKSDLQRQSLLPTFESARYVQAVIDAIRQSSRDRCWTKVRYHHW